tara:strand:+ start:56 stop:718 length:663 start_codon:yes stop_codon:yes gene_type:complete
MSFYLYRPHIAGPSNNITTPDIIIDRVAIHTDNTTHLVPSNQLSSQVEIQFTNEPFEATPCYVLVAAGGGVLFSTGIIINSNGNSLGSAQALISRSAWRFSNLLKHISTIELIHYMGPATSPEVFGTQPIHELQKPANIMEKISGNREALPRGTIVFCCADQLRHTFKSPESLAVCIEDSTLRRNLTHRIQILSTEQDRWSNRPLPRYTVGPVGDVEHYI